MTYNNAVCVCDKIYIYRVMFTFFTHVGTTEMRHNAVVLEYLYLSANVLMWIFAYMS